MLHLCYLRETFGFPLLLSIFAEESSNETHFEKRWETGVKDKKKGRK